MPCHPSCSDGSVLDVCCAVLQSGGFCIVSSKNYVVQLTFELGIQAVLAAVVLPSPTADWRLLLSMCLIQIVEWLQGKV